MDHIKAFLRMITEKKNVDTKYWLALHIKISQLLLRQNKSN